MIINDLYNNKKQSVSEGMAGKVVFRSTGADGSTYEIIQSSPTDFMIHANSKHIDTYGSLQRAMSVLQNEVPGLQQGMAEGSGPVTHRIGLTVTDPNHPMVSKRKEPYQKSIRITQNVPDREAAINQAIAHYRRKGYKVHDHHYIGTVDQGVSEGQLELNTPDPVVVVQDQQGKILDKVNLSVAAQKYKLGQPQNIKNQLAHQNYTKIGSYTIVSPMSGQPQDQTTTGQKTTVATPGMAEASLGDYRNKATVNKAVAQANRFLDRDDPEKVAAADQTIAKREKGLARADARVKPYTPPKFDAEKHQRDLTAKYPNIDELVADAEQRRDQHYDRAEGDAYYRGRDAEQNYQKLKQIQRVIQGLNESLNRSHLP